VYSPQLSLSAAVKTKQPNVPVFLIYAGIIHAIGLALLLPMLVTLPGPDGEIAPETSVIAVEIIPAPPRAAIIVQDGEQTSALPSAPHAAAADAAVEPEPVEAVTPEAEPEGVGDDPAPPQEEPEETAAQPETKAGAAKSAKPARAARKPVAARSRSAKPAVRRSAKTQAKIAPFNGALSGLLSPGGAGEAALGAISED
jgi:hypothetical protein